MKIKKWICPILILLCLAVSWIYDKIDTRRTDTQAPRISIVIENLEISVSDPQSALLRGLRAEDDRDGDLTDSLIVESVKLLDKDGHIRVNCAVVDRSGNVAKIQRDARYTDYTSPRFALNAPLLISDTYDLDLTKMIEVRDVVDGDISHRIRVTNLNGSTLSAGGSYEMLFAVTNSLGDTAQLRLPMEILPQGRVYNRLCLTDYLIYLPVGAEFTAENYLKELTASQGVVSLTEGLPEGYTMQTDSYVDTQVPGVYVVDYQVSDSVRFWESRLIVVVEE